MSGCPATCRVVDVGLDEAALVGGQRVVADGRDVGREGDQVVECAHVAVGVAGLARGDLGDDLAGVSVDRALGELRR